MSRVLLTRPRRDSAALARRIRAAGHQVLIAPMAEPLWLMPDLPEDAQALVLTSAHALEALRHHPNVPRRLQGLPLHAIGPATARAARRAGFKIASQAGGDRAALKAALARRHAGQQVLYLCGEPLTAPLDAHGVVVVARTLYRMVPNTRLPAPARRALLAGEVDWAVLLSANTARIFRAIMESSGARRDGLKLACLSPAVAAAAGQGWGDIVVAREPDVVKLLTAAKLLCQTRI